VALTPQQEEAWFAELAKMGRERVRDRLDHGTISPAFESLTWDWLSKEEAEEKGRREASNSEQIEIARRASIAAERAASEATRQATAAEAQALEARRANTRATIALIIAIVSIIATTIGTAVSIWISLWGTHK
jgi:hypothetical protein